MRRVGIIGFAAVVCAFSAFTASAFGTPEKKPKLVFGHFEASIVGKTITEKEPAPIVENKEDEPTVTELLLGPYKFGVVEEPDSTINYEEPCELPPKVTGKATAEESFSLLTEVTFRRCVSSNPGGGLVPWKASSFKLAFKFEANESAELGSTEGGIEILKQATAKFRGVNSECLVVIPQQFVPGKAETDTEHFWEAVTYEPEPESDLENWERNKKLKEEYPLDLKNRLGIETTEKFKGIHTLVDTAPTKKAHGCPPAKGVENTKLITEKEIEVMGEHGLEKVANPYYLWTEYTNGKIVMDAEGLEIKGGQLTFVEP